MDYNRAVPFCQLIVSRFIRRILTFFMQFYKSGSERNQTKRNISVINVLFLQNRSAIFFFYVYFSKTASKTSIAFFICRAYNGDITARRCYLLELLSIII